MIPRSSQIDSTALRYFEAAAEHLSVRHAAQALNISASSVSRQIAGLEDQLGISLFERCPWSLTGNQVGMILTPCLFVRLCVISNVMPCGSRG